MLRLASITALLNSQAITNDCVVMTTQKSFSLRKLYAAEFLARGVAGLERLGFHKANFEGMFHGSDNRGIYAPMVRISGQWLEFIDVTFVTSQPAFPIINVTIGVFDGKVPAIEDLDGVKIIDLIMAAQKMPKTQFQLNRVGWSAFFDKGRRYEVKKGLSLEETQRQVDRAISLIIADAVEFEKTRIHHIKRQGVWSIELRDSTLVPKHRILPKSAAMTALLASD